MNEGGNVQVPSNNVMSSLFADSVPRTDTANTQGYEEDEWGNMPRRDILPHYFTCKSYYRPNFNPVVRFLPRRLSWFPTD